MAQHVGGGSSGAGVRDAPRQTGIAVSSCARLVHPAPAVNRRSALIGAPLTLEWLGCAPFRVRVAGLTLFFDTYVDRVPGTGASGVTAAAIDDADFVFLSHAHFD